MKTQHKNGAVVMIITMLLLMFSLESKTQLIGAYRICKAPWKANPIIGVETIN